MLPKFSIGIQPMNNSGISSMNKYQVESINDKSNEYSDLIVINESHSFGDLIYMLSFSGKGSGDCSKYSPC